MKPPPEAEASAAPAGKKAPPPKGKAAVVEEKEAPPAAPERKFEIEIRVVDAALGTSVRTVTEATIFTVSTLNVKINISMDGRVFCVTHGDKSAVFLIAGVALADTKTAGVSTTSAAVGLANIPEDRYPSVTEVHLYECKQVALINLTEILSSDNSKSVVPIWNCIVVGSTAVNAPLPLDALSFPARNYKFILIPEHRAKWFWSSSLCIRRRSSQQLLLRRRHSLLQREPRPPHLLPPPLRLRTLTRRRCSGGY